MSRLVRPQTLRGFRDLLSDEMLLRNEVVDRVRKVYELYGYVPIDTPAIELLPTLVGAGGEEADKQIFQLLTPEQQAAGLRFDLTVPFARIIAQYHPHEIKLPFRRYHIGPVFRADDPQPEQGRFRQFTQFDVDIAGTSSVAADAEIVAIMDSAFRALGLKAAPDGLNQGYVIRFNNRRLMDAFLDGVGVKDQQTAQVLRVLDKRDKISEEELADELADGRTDKSGDRITGIGLDAKTIDSILTFINVESESRASVAERLLSLVKPGRIADTATKEVEELLSHLDAYGIDEHAARFDPSLARGLAYYTGTVFEGALLGAGVGSIMGGGRYDGLVSRFRDEPIPAVGASIGLDRLITGLTNLGITLGVSKTAARVLVLVMRDVPVAESSRVAHELRTAGIATELYVGDEAGKVGRQLAFANDKGFDVAVILGRSELESGTVTVKDLKAGLAERALLESNDAFRAAGSVGQVTCPRGNLMSEVTRVLQES